MSRSRGLTLDHISRERIDTDAFSGGPGERKVNLRLRPVKFQDDPPDICVDLRPADVGDDFKVFAELVDHGIRDLMALESKSDPSDCHVAISPLIGRAAGELRAALSR